MPHGRLERVVRSTLLSISIALAITAIGPACIVSPCIRRWIIQRVNTKKHNARKECQGPQPSRSGAAAKHKDPAPDDYERRANIAHAVHLVPSNDRVERPATMPVPRPDAAHDASRSARTRCLGVRCLCTRPLHCNLGSGESNFLIEQCCPRWLTVRSHDMLERMLLALPRHLQKHRARTGHVCPGQSRPRATTIDASRGKVRPVSEEMDDRATKSHSHEA
jgi:hypothetical protein